MASSLDADLALVADQRFASIRFTDTAAGARQIVRINRLDGSFWLEYNESKDFGRLHSVPDKENTDFLVLSHMNIDFFFHKADFNANNTILAIEEMEDVEQLLRHHEITALEFRVYHNFRRYGVYDPISVWRTRELEVDEHINKISLKFLCRMLLLANILQDDDFGRIAVEIIGLHWQRKSAAMADLEVMMEHAPQLDELVKDRMDRTGVFAHTKEREGDGWIDRFHQRLPQTFARFGERVGLVLEVQTEEEQPREYDDLDDDLDTYGVYDGENEDHQEGGVPTREDFVKQSDDYDEYVDSDFAEIAEASTTGPTESSFGAYYNKPLTGNPFYDSRPSPNYSLLDGDKASSAALSATLGVGTTHRASIPKSPTAPKAFSTSRISAPRSAPVSRHASHTPFHVDTCTVDTDDLGRERTRRDAERAQANAAKMRGAPASDTSEMVRKREHVSEEGPTKKARHAGYMGPHRRFKPTTKKARRRWAGLLKPAAASGVGRK